MSIELWAAILAAAALVISLISAYFAKHSVSAAERSALAAERAADAARDQADEIRRANDLVEQERRRGIRAASAATEGARMVGWVVERGTRPDLVRLRNVGEATATNVSVEPVSTVYMMTDRGAGPGGPTVQPNEAIDLSLMGTAESVTPTFLLVSWAGVQAPVSVPIPPE